MNIYFYRIQMVYKSAPRRGAFAQYYRSIRVDFFEYADFEERLTDVASFVRVLAQKHGTYRSAREVPSDKAFQKPSVDTAREWADLINEPRQGR